jgi:hypothetical protein
VLLGAACCCWADECAGGQRSFACQARTGWCHGAESRTSNGWQRSHRWGGYSGRGVEAQRDASGRWWLSVVGCRGEVRGVVSGRLHSSRSGNDVWESPGTEFPFRPGHGWLEAWRGEVRSGQVSCATVDQAKPGFPQQRRRRRGQKLEGKEGKEGDGRGLRVCRSVIARTLFEAKAER